MMIALYITLTVVGWLLSGWLAVFFWCRYLRFLRDPGWKDGTIHFCIFAFGPISLSIFPIVLLIQHGRSWASDFFISATVAAETSWEDLLSIRSIPSRQGLPKVNYPLPHGNGQMQLARPEEETTTTLRGQVDALSHDEKLTLLEWHWAYLIKRGLAYTGSELRSVIGSLRWTDESTPDPTVVENVRVACVQAAYATRGEKIQADVQRVLDKLPAL